MPAPLSLPLIDLSPFLSTRPDPQARREVANQLHKACVEFGFFYCTGVGSVVSRDEMREALAVARDFFNRPDEEKAKLRIKSGDGARGASILCTSTPNRSSPLSPSVQATSASAKT